MVVDLTRTGIIADNKAAFCGDLRATAIELESYPEHVIDLN